MLESLHSTDDIDGCYQEGDAVEVELNQPTPSPQELERQAKAALHQAEACIAEVAKKYMAYTQALEAFNQTWMPALSKAIESKDPVAEVIMRQCSTTSVLDRSKIESTCDEKPERRAIAAQRLKEIGFAPAFDWETEAANRGVFDLDKTPSKEQLEKSKLTLEEFRRNQVLAGQDFLLEQFSHGVLGEFGLKQYRLNDHGNLDRSKYENIVSMVLSVPRAFTFSPGSDSWATNGFGTLKLVRPEALTPESLSWGFALFTRGERKAGIAGDRYAWLKTNAIGNLYPVSRNYVLPDASRAVAVTEATIDRYLQQDPRWAVFLLRRVGRHEWVPERGQSTTHKLTPDWLGEWELKDTFSDWELWDYADSSDPNGHRGLTGTVRIERDGEMTRATFKSNYDQSPLQDDSCQLRYSGGVTTVARAASANDAWAKENSGDGPDWSHTLFGDLRRGCFHAINLSGSASEVLGGSQCKFRKDYREALVPLDLSKPYQQVLVQCAKGESVNNDNLRFLLLQGDGLVEFAAQTPFQSSLFIRHYRRVNTKGN